MKKKNISFLFYTLLILIISIIGMTLFLKHSYKDEIKKSIQNNLQKITTSDIHFSDINISIWDHFPFVTIKIDSLLIADSIQSNNCDSLVYIKETSVNFSIIDIILKKNIIQQVYCEDGFINILYNKDDSISHFIINKNNEQNNALNEFVLINMRVKYFREKTKTNIDWNILTGLTEIKNNTLTIRAQINSRALEVGKVNYLNNMNCSLNLILTLLENKIKLEKNSHVLIEEVLAQITGEIGKNKLVNLNIEAEKQQLKHIIRYMPENFRKLTKSFLAEGLFDCKAQIIKQEKTKENPFFNMDFTLNNGELKIKKRPFILKNIHANGNINNGVKRNFKTTKIKFLDFTANTKEGNINSDFIISNLNKFVLNANIKSTWSVEELNQYFKNSPFLNVSGKIYANTKYNGNFSFNKALINYFLLAEHNTNMKLMNIKFNHINSNLDFNIDSSNLLLTNQDIDVYNSNVNIAGNNCSFTGKIKKIIPFLFQKNSSIDLTGNISSDKIIYNSLTGDNNNTEGYIFPNWIKLNTKLNIEKFIYNNFYITNLTGQMLFDKRSLQGISLEGSTLGGLLKTDFSLEETTKKYLVLKSNLDLNSINIQNAFTSFKNFNQNFITSDHIKGIGTAQIDIESHWKPTFLFDSEKLTITSDLIIEKGELINFKPLEKLSSFVSIEDLKHVEFSTLKNTIEVENKIITIPKMEINSSALSVLLSGNHTFENNMDYDITLLLSELLSKKFRQENTNLKTEFGEIIKDEQNFTTIYLKMTGNKENTNIAFDGLKIKDDLQKTISKEVKFINTIIKEDILNNQERKNDDNDQDVIIEWEEINQKPN